MMDQLRGTLGKGTPQATLELARQLERTYPDGAQAQERSLYAIDALIALNRISEMRDEARGHLAKWPGTAISERVEARTGVHPEIRPPNWEPLTRLATAAQIHKLDRNQPRRAL